MRERLPSILVSYAYRKSWEKSRASNAWREVVLDSGAFTAFKSGEVIDVNAFADWALEQKKNPLVTEVFTLDVIGGDWRESLRNTETLWKRGVEAIPVYHVGEPTDVLRKLARDYPKVALGGAVGYAKKVEWAALCFREVWPKKLHGLGYSPAVLKRLPFHTVDHSNWTQGPHRFLTYEAYGGIRLPIAAGAHTNAASISPTRRGVACSRLLARSSPERLRERAVCSSRRHHWSAGDFHRPIREGAAVSDIPQPTAEQLVELRKAWDAVPDNGQVPKGVGEWLQPLINAVTEIVNPNYRKEQP